MVWQGLSQESTEFELFGNDSNEKHAVPLLVSIDGRSEDFLRKANI